MLRYFRMPPTRPVIVAGSTMKGEEAAVLRAFRRVRTTSPKALLMLAPRHPERFAEVEQLCRAGGLQDACGAASCRSTPSRAPTSSCSTRIGELATIYQIGDGGRSSAAAWCATGGHNILEPAVFGKPIVFGPHMENFAEIADGVRRQRRRRAGATARASSSEALLSLMTDPVRRARLGAAARALVEANRGAKEKTLDGARRRCCRTAAHAPIPANVRPFRPIA